MALSRISTHIDAICGTRQITINADGGTEACPGHGCKMSLADFAEINEFDVDELTTIVDQLDHENYYIFGGGAAPEIVIYAAGRA